MNITVPVVWANQNVELIEAEVGNYRLQVSKSAGKYRWYADLMWPDTHFTALGNGEEYTEISAKNRAEQFLLKVLASGMVNVNA